MQIVVKNIFAECQALGELRLCRVPADLALGKELSKFFLILCRVLDRVALGKADPALGKERIRRLMHAAPQSTLSHSHFFPARATVARAAAALLHAAAALLHAAASRAAAPRASPRIPLPPRLTASPRPHRRR